jgi:hypothetical protein
MTFSWVHFTGIKYVSDKTPTFSEQGLSLGTSYCDNVPQRHVTGRSRLEFVFSISYCDKVPQ